MKKAVSIILALVLMFSLFVPAAATAATVDTAITYRGIGVYVNGVEITPCDGNGNPTEPFIMNSTGSTYLPVRAVANALGLSAAWDGATNTITLTSGAEPNYGTGTPAASSGSRTEKITYRNIKIYLDGQLVETSAEPFIMNSNGTTYLPLRAVAGALGLEVGWDSATSTVSLGSKADDNTLVVSTENIDKNLSPFFSTADGNATLLELTHTKLINLDREGQPVLRGIEGEVRNYRGTDYTYKGIADLEITENRDGTVYYDITIRNDVRFSDGTHMDIDDVIFSLYTYLDPMYDGTSSVSTMMPIAGLEEYRAGIDSRMNLILAAGPDGYTSNKLYTSEQYNTFWNAFWAAGDDFCREIVAYCTEAGYSDNVDDVCFEAAAWAYDLPTGATVSDFFRAIVDNWGYDISDNGINYERAYSSMAELIEKQLGKRFSEFTAGVATEKAVPNISGIQKTGDYSLRIVLEYAEPFAIYALDFPVSPLHYYGDESLYNYESNSFGFPKGDLSKIKSVSSAPMGSGPYVYEGMEGRSALLKANKLYYEGCPKTGSIKLTPMAELEKINGIISDQSDIAKCAYSPEVANMISSANSNGELSGDTITTAKVDYNGYGYVGINAKNVCINTGKGEDDYGSEASKNLRKAIATIIAVNREKCIDSYYGEGAEVLEYSISDSSWAAPKQGDDGYREAFSTAYNGKNIYTPFMSEAERYEAAKNAALGYLIAAGYTVKDGKVVSAPAGGELSFYAGSPADGLGDHPAFGILIEAADMLDDIGIELIVTDYADFGAFTNALTNGQIDIFAQAWGLSADPTMMNSFYSYGYYAQNYYHIADAELDALILEENGSTDFAFREAVIRECLDIVADWAIEIPTYQRNDFEIFSTERLNLATLTPDITCYWSWTNDIERLQMK